jgi:predicted RNA-binding Zn-ribbon protein involved in translation (DUF1610 family)
MILKEKCIITNEQYYDTDEMYVDIYKCPYCRNANIIADSNYCPYCGIKLIWKLEEEV